MKKYYYGIKELRCSFRDCNGIHEGEITVIVGDKIVCHCRYGELQPRDCTFEIPQEKWDSFLDILVNKYKVLKLNQKTIRENPSDFDDDLSVHLYIARTFFRKIELDSELGNYYTAPILRLIQKYIIADKVSHCHKCACMSEFRAYK